MATATKLRRARATKIRQAHAKHKRGECTHWDKHPLSKDPEDPPGTRIIDGVKWTPSRDPSHEPCTMCDPSGKCWTPWTPGGGTTPTSDPEKTPLSKFPRWPVFYIQEAQIGTDKVSPERVRKYLDYPKQADPGSPPALGGGRLWLSMRTEIAIKWVHIAEKHANTPSRKAWIARLKREFYTHTMQQDCTLDCWAKFRQLWLIANAAQYLAARFAKDDKLTPPYVPPPKPIMARLVDWFGNTIKDAVVESKTGWYVAGGLAVLASGALYWKWKS